MLFRKNLFIVFNIILLSLSSCEYDESEICEEKEKTFVSEVTGENQGKVGESVLLEVKIPTKNGCASFDRFIKKRDGKTYTLVPSLAYQTCGACVQNAPLLTVNYGFKTGRPGSYQLKFKSGENEFIRFGIRITAD